MKLWKENRKYGEWELPDEEIAKRFMASRYYQGKDNPICRDLIYFITDKDGLNSVFEYGEEGSGEAVRPIIKIIERLEG